MCECVCRDGTVEPLDPPASSSAGDRVYVDGYQHDIAGGTHIHVCHVMYYTVLPDYQYLQYSFLHDILYYMGIHIQCTSIHMCTMMHCNYNPLPLVETVCNMFLFSSHRTRHCFKPQEEGFRASSGI